MRKKYILRRKTGNIIAEKEFEFIKNEDEDDDQGEDDMEYDDLDD